MSVEQKMSSVRKDKKQLSKQKRGARFMRKKADKNSEENEMQEKVARYCQGEDIDSSNFSLFEDFPLSKRTLQGLADAGFVEPTEIQRDSLALALRGMDILGAAKTGSGKTLAFIIPALECLWREKWSRFDGLGVLIISPTRELAYQTYQVLTKVGNRHDFSAGLIIGGTEVKFERKHIGNTNIVICTPGRLLQHFDENPSFDSLNLKMLILDEADRILDMGFKEQLSGILDNLPESRQTLLFSATQTRAVKDLARLSLKDPVYISAHSTETHTTPEQLRQSYVVCSDGDKLSFLWSFIKNHLRTKILVFMATCKQVRFVYQAFKRLRPGMTILALHGNLTQYKRVKVYDEFCEKQHAILLSTDIAGRGLDFPAVNWVVQLDCPSDVKEYIHRSGRTARYKAEGESLLVLTPAQQLRMIKMLENERIPIEKIDVNPSKLWNLSSKLEGLCASDKELKEFAQRAFIAHVRSVFMMRDKELFDVKAVDTEHLAKSFGLLSAPRIRFLKRHEMEGNTYKASYEASETIQKADEATWHDTTHVGQKTVPTPISNSNEEEEDFLSVKKTDVFGTLHGSTEEQNTRGDNGTVELPHSELNVGRKKSQKLLTRAAIAKKLLKKKDIQLNQKKVFAEDEEEEQKDEKNGANATPSVAEEFSIEEAQKRMIEEDKIDRETYKKRVKEKHRAERLKKKQKEAEEKGKRLKKANKEAFSGEEDSESDGPDLSWLPDPDKIYNQGERKTSDPNHVSVQKKKRKKDTGTESAKVLKKRKMLKDMSIEDQEDMILNMTALNRF